MPDNSPSTQFTKILQEATSKLANFVEKVTTLEVMTVVTDFEVTITSKPDKPLQMGLKEAAGTTLKPDNGAYSGINAVTGDIKTIWSTNLDPVADAALLQAHNANVALSREIFQKNVEMVGDLIRKFTD